MLSPASHRVCCLAVMAPALTKADRQADCLPVVLSESFCVSKTNDTFNGEGRISEIRLKCAYSEYTQSKRRTFMHRACWRTPKNGPGILSKYRSINDSSRSLLFTKRVRAQTKYKTWQSTKATTAYADKIKLKYTMNRNTSNLKNMGLAKANTSLAIQGLKMKRFSKENLNTNPNIVEDSLNFSDSADSTMQEEPPVSDLTVLTPNTESDVYPVDGDANSCVNNGERTCERIQCSTSDTVYSTIVSESVLGINSESLSTNTNSNSVEAMDASNSSVMLTDLLHSIKNPEPSNVLCTTLSTTCDPSMDSAVIPENSVELQSSVNDSVLEILEQSENSLPLECDSGASSHYFDKNVKSSVEIFNVSNDMMLTVFNGSSGSNVMSSYPILCSKLRNTTSRSHPFYEVRNKYPVIKDNRFGVNYLMCVRKENKPCCLPSDQELVSLESIMADKAKSAISALISSTLSLQKPMITHIKSQISNLVDYYQRKFQIPCQQQAKHPNTKFSKDLVDLKAELLQSEDVKSMSTAALVNLVRKLESSGAQAKVLSPNVSVSSAGSDVSESVQQNLDPEDIADIKYTSGVFLRKLKQILKISDPDLTDSSEEETETESEDEDTSESSSVNKIALWKYLTERAKLASRSTWLIARIHELDYRMKEYTERLNEITKSAGRVSLEESVGTSRSALSNQESDNANLQTSAKQAAVKSFLPLNGFLDRSDASRLAKTAANESFQSELDDPERTDSDTEVEGSCCRTRPLNVGAFRKRKLIYIPGLHANPKFSRLSTVNCSCNSLSDLSPCILCTGQYTSIQSVDPDSMTLRDRIAILDPYFHPALSTDKDIPLTLHMENVLKFHPKFQFIPEPSTDANAENETQQVVRPKFSDLRSHRKLSRYARSLSAKYRKKHHARNARHLRKHKLVFGKWRRLQNKHTLRARNRFRRYSVASSGSSPDSPVHSPMSVFDDGFEKKRRDDSQFDIDDVIIPCNSRSGRMVEIQYKEIMIPSWRSKGEEGTSSEMHDIHDVENITDSYLNKRHDLLKIEEKEKVKRSALGLNKRGRRNRCDSRADSSGANTPDPISLYNQDVFQAPNFLSVGGPASPSPSSPATPCSAVVSDDSQPACSNSLLKRKLVNQKRSTEEITINRPPIDFVSPPIVEVSPYEPLTFPLPNDVYEELLAETVHDKETFDFVPSTTPSFHASPLSSSSSTSTVEEDEDITDPEWTVVRPMGNLDQALVLKLAKR